MKASELARATAEWFTDHPWGRGSNYNDETGAMCIRGALRHLLWGTEGASSSMAWTLWLHRTRLPRPATPSRATRRTLYSLVLDALAARTGEDATQYNDIIAVDVDEIIATMKHVAEDLEEQGL